jgi:putative transposase
LIIVDTFLRFSPALEPRFSFRDADVVEVLERVGREIGLLASTRVDQGTEFVSRDLWPYQRGFETRKADRQCVYRSFQQSFPN